MGYTDLGDSIEDMKMRAEHRAFNFPFLYDGETQEATTKFGPTATPHVFVFDQARTLRYQGRIDSSPREVYAKVADTRKRDRRRARRRHGAGREDADRRLLDQVAGEDGVARRRAGRDQEGAGDARRRSTPPASRRWSRTPTAARRAWSTSGRRGARRAPRSSPTCRRRGGCTASARSSWSRSPSTSPTRRPASASSSRRSTRPRRTCCSGRSIPTS